LKKSHKKWISVIIPLLLGFFFIIYAYNTFSSEEIEEIKINLKNVDYFYIFLSVVFGFIGSFLRSYRWKYTLKHLNYKVGIINRFFAVNVGYLMNMFVPRSGEISRALILKSYNEVPFDKGFGTIVAERMVDFFLFLAMIGVVFFLQFHVVKIFVLEVIPLQKIILFALVIILLFFAFIFYYLKRKKDVFLIKKIKGFKEGVWSLFQMKNKWLFLFHTLLIWVSYIFMLWIAIFAFPETSTLDLTAVLTTFVVGSIAITFTNNGFGSYPFLVAQILLFYEISAPIGTAFGWVVWIVQTILILVLGLISLFLLPILNKLKRKSST